MGTRSAGSVLLGGRGVRTGAAVRASESLPDNRWDDRPAAPRLLCLRGTAEEAAPTVTAAAVAAAALLLGPSCRLDCS